MDKLNLLSETNKSKASNWKEKCLENIRIISTKKEISVPSETSLNLVKKKDTIEKNLAVQLDEIRRITEELHHLKHDDNDSYVKQKYYLYLTISNITLDLLSFPNEIKGYVGKPFKFFNLNTEKYSEFYISNYLWNLISGEAETISEERRKMDMVSVITDKAETLSVSP